MKFRNSKVKENSQNNRSPKNVRRTYKVCKVNVKKGFKSFHVSFLGFDVVHMSII